MKRIVCILLLIVLLLLCGCAVATTANVDMPDTLAQGASGATIATGVAAAEATAVAAVGAYTDMVDIAVVSATPPPKAREAAPPDAVIENAPEAVLSKPVPDAVLSVPTTEPAAAAQTPGVMETPAPTEQPTPTPTPAPEYAVTEMDAAGYVAAGSVNLRTGPDTSYDIVQGYEQYDEVHITGKCGDWYRVEAGGNEGFMLKEYVKRGSVPTPTPEPTPTPKPKSTPKPTSAPKPTEEPAAVLVTPAPVAQTPASEGDDLYLLAQLVHEESGEEGYVAVANVLYNRVNSSKFPNTIRGVIFQSGQFSPADSEAELRAVTPSSSAIAAVQQVFVAHNTILPSDVLYFRAAGRGTTWGKRVYFGTFGGNDFFS